MDLTDRSQLLEYLKANGLWAKHGLGQNFLVSREVLDSIIEAAELKPHPTSPSKGEELIIEVGPGVGTLTKELIQHAGKVVAVELDEKLAGLLKSNKELGIRNKGEAENPNTYPIIPNTNLEIINADILKLNIPELIGSKKYKVVANIPYYITSKIIQLFLTQTNKPELVVMLVQKEVAERICARPGEMSTLSISVQAYGEPEIIQIVPKESFFPIPKVDSAILRIRIRNKELGIRDEQAFFRLVHIGFASRRKTLANNLSAGLQIDKNQAADIIKEVGLGENIRAQELSVGDWGKLEKELGDRN